jgi:hypothetical protein
LLAGRRVLELTSQSQLLWVFLLSGHYIAGFSSGSWYNRIEFVTF